MASNGTATCVLFASDPTQAGLDVEGYGWQYCWGDVVMTKLRVTLQKHNWGWWWNNLHQVDTGWQYADYLFRGVYHTCLAGTYTYRIIADGSVMTSSTTESRSVTSSSMTYSC